MELFSGNECNCGLYSNIIKPVDWFIRGSMMDLEGKFCKRFQNAYVDSSWLLATCSWHDRANYLILIF